MEKVEHVQAYHSHEKANMKSAPMPDWSQFALICVFVFVIISMFQRNPISPIFPCFPNSLPDSVVSLRFSFKYMSIDVIKRYMYKILIGFFGLICSLNQNHIWHIRVHTRPLQTFALARLSTMLVFHAFQQTVFWCCVCVQCTCEIDR